MANMPEVGFYPRQHAKEPSAEYNERVWRWRVWLYRGPQAMQWYATENEIIEYWNWVHERQYELTKGIAGFH